MAKLAEHFDPIGIDSYLAVQHIDRYRFAQKFIRPNDSVLDIACGSGYGTMMLLRAGGEVVGCDYDETLIGELRDRWKCDKFRYANALSLPFRDEYFDVVVSFETIEHLTDSQSFISEIRRVLKPGGIFICSTPNICYTAHPELHVKEYQPKEFFQLMKNNFSQVEKFGQYFRPSDRINDLYHWHYKSQLQHFSVVKSSTIFFLKQILNLFTFIKRFMGYFLKSISYGNVNRQISSPITWEKEIGKICKTPASIRYGVQSYKGPKWLRIMVTVAGKG